MTTTSGRNVGPLVQGANLQVAVVGGGHVGLALAAHLAGRGVTVLVVDRPARVRYLEEGGIGFFEPGLADAVTHWRRAGRLRYADDLWATRSCTVHFICVGDTRRRGRIDEEPVRRVLTESEKVLSGGTVCVRTTVPVGSTRMLARAVPRTSLVYLPEFLHQGRALKDLGTERDLVAGTQWGRPDACLARLADHLGWHLSTCTWETAEAVKILCNTLRALRIGVVNEFHSLFADLDLDYRFISSRLAQAQGDNGYSIPGLPAGGSCLPAVTEYLVSESSRASVELPLVAALTSSNDRRLAVLAELVAERSVPAGRVLVLGLTYKADTDDCTGSYALRLVRELAARDLRVQVVDPHVRQIASLLDGNASTIDLEEGLAWADHVVLAVPHRAFLEQRAVLLNRPLTDLTGQVSRAGDSLSEPLPP